eukprot:TRINITY_DN54555_c0_g1_i1.p2 TRINITY_DN54555_c0_g1~~TRINITY_DN54555_c0_g1_i1.p2  ORF type:complete len:107 (-),score=6.96 TRINITY_DN54555_c0_g1_i1:7-327(-)
MNSFPNNQKATFNGIFQTFIFKMQVTFKIHTGNIFLNGVYRIFYVKKKLLNFFIHKEEPSSGQWNQSNTDFSGSLQLLNRRHDQICLLYTSPSPRDLSTSRMPSSA